ncbi:alpha/beta hydrolase [Tissierella sp. MSJ-40]|uniref:Alpha/beta hydrolase n=1 Tax=Tissierella simiarum TaxID=2841534 RepID=A0ABS6E9B7_9FIRM|nr:alpha/beta hydrolase [Tissierella simiarum]MBU5439131.1 alpha/beta hydrolase [Tissierella simiarum]
MIHKIFQSKRGEVHYWINLPQTNTNCIVFLHGMTADHSMFDNQVKYFNTMAKTLVLDLPLHGNSRPYDDFSYKNLAEDLYEILEMENEDNIIIVGQSMGGYLAQEYGILFPDKVKGMVLVDTNPYGHQYYSKLERYLLSMMGILSKPFPYQMLLKSIAKRSTTTKEAYENMHQAISKLNKKEIINIMNQAYRDFLKKTDTVTFNFPVLLVVGDKDTTGNVIKYNKMWAKNNNYSLKYIKNAAHNSNVDNPKEFNKILESFLHKL